MITTKVPSQKVAGQFFFQLLGAAWLALSLLALCSCSSTPTTNRTGNTKGQSNLQSINWLQHSRRVGQIETWTLQGKLGIRSPNDATSANLLWQQSVKDYHIRLSGPFGQGAIHIDGDANGITLQQAGQPTIQARDVEQLLAQQLGWHFPIQQVFFWVRGLPAPDLPINKIALADNVLQHLEQGGWQLNYSRYRVIQPERLNAIGEHVKGGVSLPGKIVLVNDTLKITFILKQWQLAKMILETAVDRPDIQFGTDI